VHERWRRPVQSAWLRAPHRRGEILTSLKYLFIISSLESFKRYILLHCSLQSTRRGKSFAAVHNRPGEGIAWQREFCFVNHPLAAALNIARGHVRPEAYVMVATMPTIPIRTAEWNSPSVERGDERTLDDFLKAVERRALRMAELATRNRDEALDLVQDAMFGFVRHYAGKPAVDWAPLFFRVLDSRLHDWHRRRQVRGRWLGAWLHESPDDGIDALTQAPDTHDPGPLLRLAGSEAAHALDSALAKLPLRQRQTFLLRVWEGFDVAATAAAMRCSEGSVKTHLSRALTALRRELEDYA